MAEEVIVDARGLEPPEPMELVLSALCALRPGQRVLMLLEREPVPLFRILERNGYGWRCTPRDDGVFEILIWEGA